MGIKTLQRQRQRGIAKQMKKFNKGEVAIVNGRSCSTSLTSKGLRLLSSKCIHFRCSLQHLPDFKGIETRNKAYNFRWKSCSTSLTSKGLRLF